MLSLSHAVRSDDRMCRYCCERCRGRDRYDERDDRNVRARRDEGYGGGGPPPMHQGRGVIDTDARISSSSARLYIALTLKGRRVSIGSSGYSQ